MGDIVQRKPYKRDPLGIPIPAGTSIVGVLEVSISTASFVEVVLGAADFCKAILVGTRDEENWLLSNVSAGTTYKTMPANVGIDIAGSASETLFYAKGTSTTTLEIVLLD